MSPAWAGAGSLPQLPFRRLFKRLNRPVPEDAEIVTAYTDGEVTLRSNRAKERYHEAKDLSTYQGVEPGDFVVHGLDIMRGSLGVSDSRGAMSPVCVVCSPRDGVEPRYMAYAMRLQADSGYPKAMARGVRDGGADFRRWETLAELPLPVPSADEQRAVADYLDRETELIDQLNEKQNALIERLRERRTSLVVAAITRGAGDADTVPTHLHWSPEIPASWSVLPLKRILAEVQTGVWGDEPDGGPDDTLCVRVADFDRPRLRAGTPITIRKVSSQDRRKVGLRRGDLLIEKSGGTTVNPVGFVAYYDMAESAVCANFIARLRVRAEHSSRYWLYALYGSYASGLTWKSVKQTTGIQNLDMDAFLAESFPVPPSDEQLVIVEHLDRETAKIDELIAKVERHIELAKERKSALITAAVTGQIDVGAA